MYLILREVNSTLLKWISLAEDSLDSREDMKVYLEYNLSGTGAGGTQM
jgi:hypothetical protein